jgi:hypothetical protein
MAATYVSRRRLRMPKRVSSAVAHAIIVTSPESRGCRSGRCWGCCTRIRYPSCKIALAERDRSRADDLFRRVAVVVRIRLVSCSKVHAVVRWTQAGLGEEVLLGLGMRQPHYLMLCHGRVQRTCKNGTESRPDSCWKKLHEHPGGRCAAPLHANQLRKTIGNAVPFQYEKTPGTLSGLFKARIVGPTSGHGIGPKRC